jgi:hypothetical protein
VAALTKRDELFNVTANGVKFDAEKISQRGGCFEIRMGCGVVNFMQCDLVFFVSVR